MTLEKMMEKHTSLKAELWKQRKLAVSYFFGFSISLAIGIACVVARPDWLAPALIFFPALLIPSGICTFFYGRNWYRLSQSVAEYGDAISSKDRESWVVLRDMLRLHELLTKSISEPTRCRASKNSSVSREAEGQGGIREYGSEQIKPTATCEKSCCDPNKLANHHTHNIGILHQLGGLKKTKMGQRTQ